MPLDPNVAGLLTFMEALGAPAISEGTPEAAREAIRNLMTQMVDADSLAVVDSVEDITIDGRIPARVYRPVGQADSAPTIVYYHGGGFVIGDLDTHDGVCRLLSRDVDAVVISVDYALAPEYRFPQAVEDSYRALQWVAERIATFGADPARIAVGGDSAGGNLAAVCAQLAHADGLALAAQLLVYPAVDLLGDYPSREENATGYFLTIDDMRWFAQHYLGADESDPSIAALAVDPRLSPLHSTNLAGLAPAVVATAEYDPLRDEGNVYAERLAAAGVKVEHQQFAGLIHGFYGMERISPAIVDATAWINSTLRTVIG